MAEKMIVKPVEVGSRVFGRFAPHRGEGEWYGTVVYVNRKGRHCIVEFDVNGRKLREGYQLMSSGVAYHPLSGSSPQTIRNYYLRVVEK